MPSTKSIYFSITNKIIEKLAIKLDKQLSRKEIAELAKNYLIDLVENKKEIDPDLEYKILRNQKIKKSLVETDLNIEIKKRQLQHWDSFGTAPSKAADKAIKEGFRELTSEEVEHISKFIALEHTFDGYRITCLQCTNQFNYKTRLEALHDAARHLSAVHGKKILQK